ncbi:hypothetical protein [Deinococcus frigens]|uniref:hypothetical protein n=1 Tax=Deinococcus frigens TaxID=249403 RepID=UPI001FDFA2D1|nr:hypothetical protein [Deinococcus frigens]
MSQRYLLRSLGNVDVIVDGVSVVWPARNAEELLWYLHTNPQGRYRHDILAQLWDLEDTPAAANRFRVALHRLRATLGRPDAVQEEGAATPCTRTSRPPATPTPCTVRWTLPGAAQSRASRKNCSGRPWPARTASTCRTFRASG